MRVEGSVDGSHGTVIPSLMVQMLLEVGERRHNTFLLVFADYHDDS